MTAKRYVDIYEAYDRFFEGERMREDLWDYTVVPNNASQMKEKYDIKFGKEIVPTDEDLCERLFLAGIEMLSYTTGPLLGQLRSGLMARTRLGIAGSIGVGGALCVAGTALLAVLLPRFVAYDGEHGMALKKAADEEWAATAGSR